MPRFTLTALSDCAELDGEVARIRRVQLLAQIADFQCKKMHLSSMRDKELLHKTTSELATVLYTGHMQSSVTTCGKFPIEKTSPEIELPGRDLQFAGLLLSARIFTGSTLAQGSAPPDLAEKET